MFCLLRVVCGICNCRLVSWPFSGRWMVGGVVHVFILVFFIVMILVTTTCDILSCQLHFFYVFLTISQQFNGSTYTGLFNRVEDNEPEPAQKSGDCVGCSSGCSSKCVAEKGSRVNKILTLHPLFYSREKLIYSN